MQEKGDKVTLNEYFDTFMRVFCADLRPRTKEEYWRLYRLHIVNTLGSSDMESVTPEEIQETINQAADHGSRSAEAVFVLLRAVFRRALRSRRIDWSPLEALDRPKHRQQPGRALTREDLEKARPWLLDELGLALAAYAGLRRGEIAGLRWSDVDLANHQIHISRCRQRIGVGEPKSASGCRSVPIDPEILPLIKAEYSLGGGYCLPYAPEYLSHRWADVQRVAGLSQHYRLHDLRHTYITRLAAAGVPPHILQYLAGHASLSTTSAIYTHITASDAQDSLATLYAAR